METLLLKTLYTLVAGTRDTMLTGGFLLAGFQSARGSAACGGGKSSVSPAGYRADLPIRMSPLVQWWGDSYGG